MAIILRPGDQLREDDQLLIHMGAGALDHLLDKIIDEYDAYRGVNPDRASDQGAFAVSTYAAIDGVTRDEILAEMRHSQYGEARLGDLRDYEIWPTTITDVGVPDRLMTVHFDVILEPDLGIPAGLESDDLPDAVRAELQDRLRPTLVDLLSRFLPRMDKRTGSVVSREVQ